MDRSIISKDENVGNIGRYIVDILDIGGGRHDIFHLLAIMCSWVPLSILKYMYKFII